MHRRRSAWRSCRPPFGRFSAMRVALRRIAAVSAGIASANRFPSARSATAIIRVRSTALQRSRIVGTRGVASSRRSNASIGSAPTQHERVGFMSSGSNQPKLRPRTACSRQARSCSYRSGGGSDYNGLARGGGSKFTKFTLVRIAHLARTWPFGGRVMGTDGNGADDFGSAGHSRKALPGCPSLPVAKRP